MLAVTFVGLLSLFPTNPATLSVPVAQVAQIAPQSYSTTTVADYARLVDDAHNLKGRLYHTLEDESGGWQNEQSEIPNSKGPNGRENSWGICQINLPSHPDISREQAMDWRWCIEWSAEQFDADNADEWTEYRLLYGS